MINIKMPERLREAIRQAADARALTMSDVIRQACIEYLKNMGIDWQNNEE